MSTSSLQLTHTSVVTPDRIDELGHMNVRWYGHDARAGTVAMCEHLRLEDPALVSAYTRHHAEQLEGDRLEVRSGVLGGGPRLRFYHELVNAADETLAATFVHELDHPPLELPAMQLPERGAPRSIVLDIDRLASVPSLDTLRSRDLALRLERRVGPDDTGGDTTVPVWLAPNLIWGGERPDAADDWICTTADGDRVAFATMESRLWFGAMPELGARIQSFGALVDVGEKTTHGVNWAFDLDRNELVAVFEVVNLAFSLTSRRARTIPIELRDDHLARLQPELG